MRHYRHCHRGEAPLLSEVDKDNMRAMCHHRHVWRDGVISQTFTYVFRACCVTSEYLTLLMLPSILVPSLTPYKLIP